MKTRRIVIAIGLACSTGFTAVGQQEAQFTQYNDNMLYYNPAYAGSRGRMNILAIHRQQWVGIKGAPMTQAFALHTPLKYESLGVGLSLLNDKVGPVNQTWINGDVSYSMRFRRNNAKLAFGVTGGLNVMNARLSELSTADANDPLLSQDIQNKLLPNIGAGVFYHSEHWYAGFSIPRIVESKGVPGELSFNDQRHYYFSVGGYFNVNRMLKIRPSVMFKMTDNAPFALDGSLAFIFYDKLWLGANYRLDESAGILVQYQLTPQFKLGYSFDVSTSKLVRYNFGTHEILLSYDLVFGKSKGIITPRYF